MITNNNRDKVIRLQEEIALLLKEIFNEVILEWDVAKKSEDKYNREIYCPRLDIAVGPFNITHEYINKRDIKNNEVVTRKILSKLQEKGFCSNSFKFNKNPRCLIAIEIEASGSRKHMLGDIVNSSILGAIGIVIVIDQRKFEHFKKIKKYLDFAIENKKNGCDFRNVIIIQMEHFREILKEVSSNR